MDIITTNGKDIGLMGQDELRDATKRAFWCLDAGAAGVRVMEPMTEAAEQAREIGYSKYPLVEDRGYGSQHRRLLLQDWARKTHSILLPTKGLMR